MVKKKLLFSLSFLLLGLLSACNNNNDSSSITSSSSSEVSEDISSSETETSSSSSNSNETSSSEAHEHSFNNYKMVKEPTLTSKGEAVGTCECGETTTIEIPILTDTSTWSIKEDVKATCENNGHTTYTSTYGDVTVTTNKLGHNFGNWTITSNPTLNAIGKAKRVCKNDETHSEEVDVPALSNTSTWSIKEDVKPTEEHDGHTTYTSIYGDVTVVVSALQHTHDFGNWSISLEPTLTSKGKIKRVCSLNNAHFEEEEIASLSDTSVWSVKNEVKPTCENDGSTTYTSTYGDVTITTNKLGHNFGAWTFVNEPTTSTNGKAKRVCKNDANHSEEVEVPALSNTSTWSIKEDVKPTCENNGHTTYTSTYGDVTITTNKLGHNFGAWTFVNEPTTSTNGKAKRVCKNDANHSEEVEVPALSNTSTWSIKEDVKPTCENDGHTTYTSTYGDVVITVNKLGHKYPTWWTITKEPTLTDEGTAQKICGNDASHVLMVDVPVLTDSVWKKTVKKQATCKQEGEAEYVSEFGIVRITFEKLEHVYSDYKVKDVTFGETATIYKECESGHEIIEELKVAAPKQFSVAITDKTNPDILSITLSGNYPMIYDAQNGTWTSSNAGVGNSTSGITIAVKFDGTFEFDVVVSSEPNFDKFNYYGGAPLSGEVTQHIIASGVNGNSNSVSFSYSKDSTGDKGEDKVVISNFIFKTEGVPTGYNIDYKVIQFETNGGNSLKPIVACKNNPVDNMDDCVTTKEGYEFAGWYYDSTFKTPFYAHEGVSESTTLYAKWNKLHDVKLVYNNGTNAETIKVADGKELEVDNPIKDDYLFEGWYTNSSFTPTSKYNATPITTNVTFYANYVKAPYFIGNYKGINERSIGYKLGIKDTNTIKSDAEYRRTLSINNDYSIITGNEDLTTWDLSSYDETTNILVSSNNTHYYYYKTKDGDIFIVCDYSSGKETICDDDFNVYVMADSAEFVSVRWTANGTTTYLYRVIEAQVNNHTTNIFIDGVNNKAYFDVNILNKQNTAITVNDVYNTDYIDFINITDANGVTINKFANKNGDFTALDGFEGEYTNETIGSFSINGIGTITVGGNDFEYVLENNLIYATINGKLTVLKTNKSNNTATIEQDDYKTTLTGESGTLVLDGFGNASLNSKSGVYTVSGKNVAVTIDRITTVYIANFEDKTFFTKSIFSGHSFKGTYYSKWYEDDENYNPIQDLVINFDDVPTISGVMYAGYNKDNYFYFTGSWDEANKELTLTFTNCITSNAIGKNLVFKVEGNTLTAISGWTANAYEFTTKCSLTSTTFSL